jgi:hypothetical protein
MLVMHGSAVQVPNPELRKARFNKDFGGGFYCSRLEAQAYRWAARYGNGYVNYYEFAPAANLSMLTFGHMTEEWLDFIAFCRNGGTHDYDIVEGPMANDEVYNYVADFLSGVITRAAFWELVKFRYPTHQISFHTAVSLDTIKFAYARAVK